MVEVSEGEQHVRVLAMERLRYVAFALSPDAAKRADRIEKELVPFLMEVRLQRDPLRDHEPTSLRPRYHFCCVWGNNTSDSGLETDSRCVLPNRFALSKP